MLVISGTARKRKGRRLAPGRGPRRRVPLVPARRGRASTRSMSGRSVDQVEQELARLRDERNMLTDEVQRLRSRVLHRRQPGRRGRAGRRGGGILSTAQRTADRCVANAEEYSRQAGRRRGAPPGRDPGRGQVAGRDDARAGARGGQPRGRGGAGDAGPAGPDRREPEAGLAYLCAFSDAYRSHLRRLPRARRPAAPGSPGGPSRARGPRARASRGRCCPQPQSLTG